jgi:hypothetical protein
MTTMRAVGLATAALVIGFLARAGLSQINFIVAIEGR